VPVRSSTGHDGTREASAEVGEAGDRLRHSRPSPRARRRRFPLDNVTVASDNPPIDALLSIFAALVVIAGVYYFTNTAAVDALAGVEPAANNKLRRNLRRLNGLAMIVLGLCFFWIYFEVEVGKSSVRLVLATLLLAVSILLSLALVAIDLWLTHRLRRRNRPPGQTPN
jgi:apolipoprotein N-acyltransferase